MNKTEEDIRDIIHSWIKTKGRKQTAKDLGILPSYLSMLTSKSNPRGIPKHVAETLGYEITTATSKVFVPKNNSQNGVKKT